ncbi:sigma-70 family RNA polymerase sigma factor [Pelagibacterium montanilacus]|uniref:sigma-70 family RNA polymerase sigma factor n=1 Tax=Pelagibacterium montanilacus TaxID=2185280 RepID=UPI000F8D2D15|nr:sigma-70 family RNA polymerase sigma factor [Pelagibacterium montanilacus]
MNGTRADIGDLLSRVALRDRAAFRELYRHSSAKLFGVSLRILKSQAEAEDAVQDVFVKIWQRAGSYRPDAAAPMTWLIAIARNHAIDELRRRRMPLADLDAAEAVADSGPTPEQAAVNASEGSRIDRCLGELEPDRAQAVRLAYVDGESYQDLADRFSIPINTMRTWLRRSLLRLRECLDS